MQHIYRKKLVIGVILQFIAILKNPNFRVYPIFRFFESWCQDENRHGDFFAAVLKSQKHLLNTFEAALV